MLSRAAVGLLGQCEVVGVVNMTQGESLDSEILARLHTQTIVDVLEVGGSGRVFALAHGKEGWLSLSSKHGEQLLRKLKMEQVEELEEIEDGADDSAKTTSGYDGFWDRLRFRKVRQSMGNLACWFRCVSVQTVAEQSSSSNKEFQHATSSLEQRIKTSCVSEQS